MKSLPLLLSLGAALVVTGCVATPSPSAEQTADTADVVVDQPHRLAVGECLNDVSAPLGAELTDVPVVPCDEPHESEVFDEIVLPGDDYPGVDELNELASEECESAFGDFVGLDYRVSELSFHYYYPTFSRWAEGDRTVYCVVFDPEGDTTNSLRGQAR